MKKISFLLLLIVGLVCGNAMAWQDAPASLSDATAAQPPELSTEQQTQLQRHNEEMAKAARQIAQWVDQGRLQEVWDVVSTAVRSMTDKDEFIRQISSDRQQVGAVESRQQVTINRVSYIAGGEIPEGMYLTVVYATKFANTPRPVRELISFRFDDDKIWRVAGYSLR
jgi:hypothetical protein